MGRVYGMMLWAVFAALLMASCGDRSDTEPARMGGYVTVFEYRPAPGQFINDPASGSDKIASAEGAAKYAEDRFNPADGTGGKYVSLGAFGGYIVVGFGESVVNSGGYDFSISGNQFRTSSEPGIVWVMADDNGNGRPDDTWYELRGSESDTEGAVKGYEITYYRPDGGRQAVRWEDNTGNSGTVPVNDFHKQAGYYPDWIMEDSYKLTGTLIGSAKYETGNGEWSNGEYAWGYADSWGSDRIDPENPNRVFFKISNAVDGDGTPVNLGSIDFIKVQTGVNDNIGALGEFSTEVTGFRIENAK